MHMLSALDATFIYLESEHSPMAIGGVYVIDASDAPEGFSYDSWYSLIKSRLKCSKVFRQRLVEVPCDLSFPYLIRDQAANASTILRSVLSVGAEYIQPLPCCTEHRLLHKAAQFHPPQEDTE